MKNVRLNAWLFGAAHFLAVAVFFSVPVSAQTTPDAPGETEQENQINQTTDDILNELVKQFDAAAKSLDDTNNSLDEANELNDYGKALSAVDIIIDKVRGLADRVKPGNATEERILKNLKDIADIEDFLRSKGGLEPDALENDLNNLSNARVRLENGLGILSEFYPQLTDILNELTRKRRAVAADVMISAYLKAADNLDATNETIKQIVEKLKTYLHDIKEPAIN